MRTKELSKTEQFCDVWCKYGCPEKMTIHDKKTGKTEVLINGLPVTDNGKKDPYFMRSYEAKKRKVGVRVPVTDNRVCLVCKRAFHSVRGDAKFCSGRCRVKSVRMKEIEAKRIESERVLAGAIYDSD